MISENIAKQFHNKSTRGESLSIDEQAALEKWYAFQDKTESHTLGVPADNANTAVTLQGQIDVALTQLTTMTKRIQEIASENEELKHEITLLRRQLAHQTPRIQAAA
ncbi:MAG: hypothetical protein GY801_27580 [bacterium]|nr:hypothetical protein [bacterium]